MGRSEKSVKNIFVGVIEHIIALLLDFLVRTVFIYTLSQEYLGINGLFVSILTVLSISELGIGTAITYALYKPLANNDYVKTSKLMELYKNCYRIIGLLILILGILMIPFVTTIVGKVEININIKLVYFIFLLEASSSYFFFSYKNALLIADQKMHIVSYVKLIVQIIKSIVRIGILVFLKNNKELCFYLYSVCGIVCTILTNVVIAYKTDELYPYTKISYGKLEKSEIRDIFKNVYALALTKIAYVINSSTDNIIITKFVSLAANGIFSNYSLIVGSVSTGIGIVSSSLVAGIGNLNALEDKNYKESFFYNLQFFYFWLYGVLFICMFCLINPFISVIWGIENCLAQKDVFSILLNFLSGGLIAALIDYRDACGVYWQNRYMPFIAAVVNIGLSLLFAGYLKIGIMGILLATTISRVLIIFPVYSFVICKHVFEKSPWKNMLRIMLSAFLIIATSLLMYCMCDIIEIGGLLGVLIKFSICFFVPNFFFLIVFYRNKCFIYWYSFLISFMKGRK